jgi:hypothetical protein
MRHPTRLGHITVLPGSRTFRHSANPRTVPVDFGTVVASSGIMPLPKHAPSYGVDDEIVRGQDRLDFAECRLTG